MKRVFLKLSGEALAGEKHTGFDEPTVTEVAKQVKEIVDTGWYRNWRWQFLERKNQRDNRSNQGRPDWNACNSHELYLCV